MPWSKFLDKLYISKRTPFSGKTFLNSSVQNLQKCKGTQAKSGKSNISKRWLKKSKILKNP